MVDTPQEITVEIPTPPEGKQRKKREPKTQKTASPVIGQTEISALICGVFNLVSMKAGEHWKVSEVEADAVSKPLCNILTKYNLAEKVANVSDGAMLLMAVGAMMIPRIMIQVAINNQKKPKKEKQDGNKQTPAIEKTTNNTESSSQSGGDVVGTDAGNGSYFKALSGVDSLQN